jgi:hypothetical protein
VSCSRSSSIACAVPTFLLQFDRIDEHGNVAVADPGPSTKRIAALLRMLGSEDGERRNAFTALERTMRSENIGWTDIGNAVEGGSDDGKFTEAEMQEVAQAMRAEGIEAGIKIGEARTGSGNGHFTLPKPIEMAQFWQERLGQLQSDWQRDFISDIFVITQGRARGLSPKRLANLAKIYIEIGERV